MNELLTPQHSPRTTWSSTLLLIVALCSGCDRQAANTDLQPASRPEPLSDVASGHASMLSWGIVPAGVSDAGAKSRISGQRPEEIHFEDRFNIANQYYCPGERSIAVYAAGSGALRITVATENSSQVLFSGAVVDRLIRVAAPEGASRLSLDLKREDGAPESWTVDLAVRQSNPERLPLSHTILNGVNVFDGTFSFTETDLQLEGFGPNLEFVRGYSAATGDSIGLAGRGWTTTADTRIAIDGCGRLTFTRWDGSTQHFHRQVVDGKKSWEPLHGYHSVVQELETGGYRYLGREGARIAFTQPDGTDWLPTLIEDKNGNQVKIEHQVMFGRALPVSVKNADGREITLHYEEHPLKGADRSGKQKSQGSVPLLVKVDGPLGWRLTLTYDDRGNQVRAHKTDASQLGIIDQRYAYEDFSHEDTSIGSRMIERRDGVGKQRRTVQQETVRGTHLLGEHRHVITSARVTQLSDVDGDSLQFSFGQVKRDGEQLHQTVVTSMSALQTVYLFSSLGLEVRRTHGSDTRITEYLEQENRLISKQTDANGRTTTYQYDHGNMVVERIELGDAKPVVRTWKYADRFQFEPNLAREPVVEEVNGRGIKTQFRHDRRGNLVEFVRGSYTERYKYGSRGELRSKRFGDGQVWRYDYDDRGLLSAETGPGFLVKKYENDALGRRITEIDHAGTRREYTFDARNRWVSRTKLLLDDDDFEVSNKFDDEKNETVTTYADGSHSTSTYDAFDRLTRYEDGDGRIYTKRYDKQGNLVREVDFARNVTKYEYDAHNRQVAEQVEGGARTEYRYDEVGNVITKVKREGDQEITWESRYGHPLYKATWIRKKVPGEEVIVWLQEFDGNGNRTAIIDESGERSEFAYDVFDEPVNTP